MRGWSSFFLLVGILVLLASVLVFAVGGFAAGMDISLFGFLLLALSKLFGRIQDISDKNNEIAENIKKLLEVKENENK